MKILKLAVLAIATAAASPVMAGGFAPAAADDTWTGAYVGGQAGVIIAGSEDGIENEIYAEGNEYGLHAGYQRQFGAFVLGAEIDRNESAINEVNIAGSGVPVDDEEWSMTRLKARAGLGMGNFMPYVSAGVARLESPAGDTDGTFLGLGAAYKVTDRFSLGAEIGGNYFDDTPFGTVDDPLVTGSAGVRASFHF